jgi:hypothetical protein
VKGSKDESTGFCEKGLPQLQDHPAQGRGAHHLQGPASQAAPGVSALFFVFVDAIEQVIIPGFRFLTRVSAYVFLRKR